MELGATVCTPHAPDCDACPLRARVPRPGRRVGATELPVRRRRERVSLSHRVVAVLERAGRILLMKKARRTASWAACGSFSIWKPRKGSAWPPEMSAS